MVDLSSRVALGISWLIPGLGLCFGVASGGLASPLGWLLLLGASWIHLAPWWALPEARRALRLAHQRRWTQALTFTVLAQHRLARQPWRAGLRFFRRPSDPPQLSQALAIHRARLLRLCGQAREAERAIRDVLRWLPHSAVMHHELALALSQQGRWRPARRALQRALDLGFQPARTPRLRTRSSLSMERAVLQPRHPDSVPFYQHQGFHRLALSLLAVPGEARHCWWRCRSRVALGQIERARVETLAELGSHPDNGYAWLSWAWLCTHREGLSQEALKAFQAARRWIPHSLEVKEQLCIALTLHGDDRALGDAQAFLEEYETDPRHRAFCLAFFHARQGRWEEVLANASRSHPGPDHLEFLELMAEASLQTGRLDQGYRLLNRFCALASLSGYPMLQRPQRLERARRRLRSLRSPAQGSGRGAL